MANAPIIIGLATVILLLILTGVVGLVYGVNGIRTMMTWSFFLLLYFAINLVVAAVLSMLIFKAGFSIKSSAIFALAQSIAFLLVLFLFDKGLNIIDVSRMIPIKEANSTIVQNPGG